MKEPSLRSIVCIGLLFLGQTCAADDFKAALKLDPDPENGRNIYVVCVGCHRPEGWGSTSGVIPQIAGQHPRVIIKQLQHFSKGYRKSPQMSAFANPEVLGGTRGIADVAAYISALPMTPDPSHGDGANLERGGALFRTACGSKCHGKEGEGNDFRLWPRLQGQHYAYLLRQMKLIRDGHRRFADNLMVRRLGRLSEQDLEAVADYLSRIEPEKERVAPPGWTNPDFREP
jgi:cytochrome c553